MKILDFWRCDASKDTLVTSEDDVQYDASYLRNMAARCRRLARQVTDKDAMAELLNMAEDFERKAAEVEPGTDKAFK
jgi:hypothetical protein